MRAVPEPLSSKLSRTLVAFTIEADAEFEHRVPHRTTNHGTTEGFEGADDAPWLVSLLMWLMCMRFIPGDGVSARRYSGSAWWLTPKGISTTLRRMGGWWGYLSVDEKGQPGSSPRASKVVRPSVGGRRAQEAWEHLIDEVGGRWNDRFGGNQVRALYSALEDLVSQFDRPLPDCLRLFDVDLDRRAPDRPRTADSLPGLLSQAICAFELEFESAHPVPMRLCGNLLRVLGDRAVPVTDLAVRTGLAKDGVESGLRVLERRKLVTVKSGQAGGRLRVASLTRAGAERNQQAAELTEAIEGRWQKQYGKQCLAALNDAFTPIAGDPGDPDGPLWAGLYRYPDGWRSALPRPETLPHHPAVSHRGGYLDGA